MHRVLSVAVVLSFATSSFSAFADEPSESKPAADAKSEATVSGASSAEVSGNGGIIGQEKIHFGLRLGLGFPMGSVEDKVDEGGGVVREELVLSDVISSQVPLWLEAGYMLTPNILVGLYFQYGFASVSNTSCSADADCSASDVRFGVQGHYYLWPGQKVNPWFGLGIGYEWLSYEAEAAGVEVSNSLRGMEYLNLQGGADVRVAKAIDVGPFLSFSLGRYSSYTLEGPTGELSGSVREPTWHEWIVIGARGTYSL